ncbi:MAG: 3-oxoacyl-ACP reductase FabG [Victivallales bacterium]|nr:3-oxoacyl-ACP reductase FabG [Victivallales bacterium]
MNDVTLVRIPRLYENMDEATIGQWRCNLGDKLKEGDALVELITDKTVIDFEAPVGGTLLAIYAQSKSTVPFNYVLCAIGEEGGVAPDVSAENEQLLQAHLKENALSVNLEAIAPQPEIAPKPQYKAAPAAKAFAKQEGINLDEVAAFCKRPMVHRKDVEDFIASQRQPEPAAPAPASVACDRRVALVTGASGGIGSAISRALAAKGNSIAIHCNNDTASAEKLAAELASQGAVCEVFRANLSQPEAAKELVAQVMARFGRIDILVNNAGCLADATVAFMSDQQWNSVLDLNLNAPFRLIRAVAMLMARNRWGRIVNIASAAGRLGSANRSNYASAKEGLLGLTRSAARELAGLGVRVNAVAPGFVDTNMTSSIQDKRRQDIMRDIPVRRFGRPEDIAAAVAFLASDEADYITGQCLSVDGGLVMG